MSLKFTDYTHQQLRRSIGEISDRSLSSGSFESGRRTSDSVRRQNLINFGYFTPRRSFRYRHNLLDDDIFDVDSGGSSDQVFSDNNSDTASTTNIKTSYHASAALRKLRRTDSNNSSTAEFESVRYRRRKTRAVSDGQRKNRIVSEPNIPDPGADDIDSLQVMYEKIVRLESTQKELLKLDDESNNNHTEEKMKCSDSDSTEEPRKNEESQSKFTAVSNTDRRYSNSGGNMMQFDCDVCSAIAIDVARKTAENEKIREILAVLQEKDSLQRKELDELQRKLDVVEKEKNETEAAIKSQLDDAVYDRDHLKKEKDDLQKVLQAIHKNLKIQQQQHKKEMKKKDVKVEKLNAEVKNLQAEICSRKEASEKVHENMVAMQAKNDVLSKENSSLQKDIGVFRKNEERKREELTVTDRLRKELAASVRDLQAVMRLMLQTADDGTGAVNLSDLLNTDMYEDELNTMNLNSTTGDSEEVLLDIGSESVIDVVGKQMADVRSVRKDLVDIRTMISDRYAENIGNSCVSQ